LYPPGLKLGLPEAPSTVLVNGWLYDPFGADDDNPHLRLFPIWKAGLRSRTADFGWYSAPHGWRHRRRAWRAGYLWRYHFAWKLAEGAGRDLYKRHLAQHRRGIGHNVFGHSMGTRVIAQALLHGDATRRRVILLNGAEKPAAARVAAARSPAALFLNVAVRDKSPCIGNVGMQLYDRNERPHNWTDVFLDDPPDWTRGRYKLKGDNPNSLGDHRWSYEAEGCDNWRFYNDFLRGEIDHFLFR
jgi:hypothetical protein